jgi:hypothetical protein
VRAKIITVKLLMNNLPEALQPHRATLAQTLVDSRADLSRPPRRKKTIGDFFFGTVLKEGILLATEN